MYSTNDFVDLISIGYALVFIVSCALVAWLVKPWRWKTAALLVVTIAFAYPLLTAALDQQRRLAHNKMVSERFVKLCKENAGEKIYKTIDGVEGFLISRPRKRTHNHQEYLDQYWMGDPYGHSDLEAENPTYAFLYDHRTYDSAGSLSATSPGYSYIELTSDQEDEGKKRFVVLTVTRRYLDENGQPKVDYAKTMGSAARSRYAYDWEDISTQDDRKFWIAGGRMRVVDLSTGEVLAQRTGYVIDPEQGARLGGGIPWLVAQRSACPPFKNQHAKAREFLTKVLKPLRTLP